jgi:FMN reductase
MAVAVLVGNPRASSRTLGLARAVGERVVRDLLTDLSVIDLAALGAALLDGEATVTRQALEQVYGASVIVVASPTFKASFAGVLKVFLDYIPGGALGGRVALPVMTGGARDHSLAVDVHLRPVLVHLGASLPTQGLYVTEPELPDAEGLIEQWWQSARAACLAVVRSNP